MRYLIFALFIMLASCSLFQKDEVEVTERRVDENVHILTYKNYLQFKNRDTIIVLKVHEQKKYELLLPIEYLSEYSKLDENVIKARHKDIIDKSKSNDDNIIVLDIKSYYLESKYRIFRKEDLFLSGKYLIYDKINKKYVDKVKVNLYEYYANVPLYAGYSLRVYIDGFLFFLNEWIS